MYSNWSSCVVGAKYCSIRARRSSWKLARDLLPPRFAEIYRASSPKAFTPRWDSHHEDVRVQAKYSFRSVVVLIGCVKSIKVKIMRLVPIPWLGSPHLLWSWSCACVTRSTITYMYLIYARTRGAKVDTHNMVDWQCTIFHRHLLKIHRTKTGQTPPALARHLTVSITSNRSSKSLE